MSLVSVVLSGRDLCVWPIARPAESYLVYVYVCMYVCVCVCVCVCVRARAPLSVIKCNNNPLNLQWVGRKRSEYERGVLVILSYLLLDSYITLALSVQVKGKVLHILITRQCMFRSLKCTANLPISLPTADQKIKHSNLTGNRHSLNMMYISNLFFLYPVS